MASKDSRADRELYLPVEVGRQATEIIKLRNILPAGIKPQMAQLMPPIINRLTSVGRLPRRSIIGIQNTYAGSSDIPMSTKFT